MVGTSFDMLHWTKLNDKFLTLQKIMEAIILCNGKQQQFQSATYLQKKQQGTGQLPVRIEVLDSV